MNPTPQNKRSSLRVFCFTLLSIALFAGFVEFTSFLIVKLFPLHFKKQYEMLHSTSRSEFHPYLGWKMMPSTTVVTDHKCDPLTGENKNSVSIMKLDEDSHPIPPVQYDRPDLTIVITGGSVMFGIGQDNTHFPAAQLEKFIRTRLGLKANIVTLAQGGYRAFNEMNSLVDYFSRGNKADIVISGSGANDSALGYTEPDNQFLLARESTWAAAETLRLLNNTIPSQKLFSPHLNWNNLTDRFYVFKILFTLKEQFHAWRKSREPASVVPPLSQSLNNLSLRVHTAIDQYTIMNALANEHGARFIMFLQPTAFTKKHLLQNERECIIRSFDGSPEYLERFREYQEAFYNAYRSEKKNYSYVDAADAFNQNDPRSMYIDSVHTTQAGAERFAEVMFEKLKPVILEKSRV